jgi:hypothetical protein
MGPFPYRLVDRRLNDTDGFPDSLIGSEGLQALERFACTRLREGPRLSVAEFERFRPFMGTTVPMNDMALISIIEQLAFGNELYDRLDREERRALEGAIQTLAHRYEMELPVSLVDGRFTQEEIRSDIRYIFSHPQIRSLFAIQNVTLHTSPVPDFVSLASPFGHRQDAMGGANLTMHEGDDFYYDQDRENPDTQLSISIRASAPGNVVRQGTHEDYGNYVVLRHMDGTYTLYAHLSNIGIPELERGQFVDRGSFLGYMGNTGRVSNSWSESGRETLNGRFNIGRHLHYEQFTYLDEQALLDQNSFGNARSRMPIYASGSNFDNPHTIYKTERIGDNTRTEDSPTYVPDSQSGSLNPTFRNPVGVTRIRSEDSPHQRDR